jgi:hypothetical protein
VLLDAVQGVDVFNANKRTRQGVGLGDYAEQELRCDLKRGYIFGIYNTQEFRVDKGCPCTYRPSGALLTHRLFVFY